ncbi:MAG TPA: chorismate mutase [Ilumatobacteraceae bacterium]|nr:chorismate mutase [Ilumatobacteraceae bacterium]
MADMDDLRARIDDLDRQLIDVIGQRLEVCAEIAERKERTDTPVIQPSRVRDVVTSRRARAIQAGIDPDFIEQLFRVLLTETHRIEVAGKRPDPAPEKHAASGVSALDTVASRIDHLVIAVEDADAVADTLCDRLGFHRRAVTATPAVVAVGAGGVELILVGRGASAAVDAALDLHGPGVRNVTIEVLNAGYAHASVAALGATIATDVLVDAHGHEQFFVTDDRSLGVSLGFLSRTGHRVGIGIEQVLAMFAATEPSG